jgi:hypothetical protein
MIVWSRIAITVEAFEAICATLPLGSVSYENETNEKGKRYVWLDHGHAWAGRKLQRCDHQAGGGGLRAPCNTLPEALDPLGQRLRTPAERRVHRRFVSAHRLVAGHGAFGQGVLGEVRAQARHSVREVAHIDADERALLCPGQLFLTALHAADSPACRGAGSYDQRQRRQAGRAGRHARLPVGA